MLSNAYVLKLTAAGSFAWVSPFIAKTAELSTAYVNVGQIAVEGAGNIVVGGWYRGPIDFNPSPSVDYRLPNSSSIDGFVAKLSPSGSLGWATRLGGGNGVNAIAVDATGVYAVGSFSGVFSPGFGLPDMVGNGSPDLFVSHLTGSGAVDWAVTNNGTGAAAASSIAIVPTARSPWPGTTPARSTSTRIPSELTS